MSDETEAWLAKQARGWNRVAVGAAVGFAASSVPYWLFGCTFGVLSGLIAFLAPLYPFLLQLTLVVVGVSAALARRWYVVARLVALALGLLPAAATGAWYGGQRWACAQAADSAACFEYLDGEFPIHLFVGAHVLLSSLLVVLALVVVQREVRLVRARTEATR
jgi:hypothetical protein